MWMCGYRVWVWGMCIAMECGGECCCLVGFVWGVGGGVG